MNSRNIEKVKTDPEGVQAFTRGASACFTLIGHYLNGRAFIKHKIKRMDRLLSNLHLYRERYAVYSALTRWDLKVLPEPVITVDWPPLCADQSSQLLRAGYAGRGRTINTIAINGNTFKDNSHNITMKHEQGIYSVSVSVAMGDWPVLLGVTEIEKAIQEAQKDIGSFGSLSLSWKFD